MEDVNLERGTEAVQAILHTNGATEPEKTRKPRSDKGIPKAPKPITDEISVKVTIDQARKIAINELGYADCMMIQDQIIAHLQKQIDRLSK